MSDLQAAIITALRAAPDLARTEVHPAPPGHTPANFVTVSEDAEVVVAGIRGGYDTAQRLAEAAICGVLADPGVTLENGRTARLHIASIDASMSRDDPS